MSLNNKAMTGKRPIVSIGMIYVLALAVPLAMGQVIAEPDVPALLTHIILTKAADGLDIKLLFTFYSSYQAIELSSPNRIVINLNGVEDIAAPRLIEVNQSGVLQIRAGMYLKGVARVVLDLTDDMPSYRIAPIKDGLILSIRPRPETAQATEPRTGAKTDLKAEGKARTRVEAKERPKAADGENPTARRSPKGIARVMGRTSETRPSQKRRFLRVIASGDYFSPRQGVLKKVYRHGMNYGGEIDIGVARFIELWIGGHYFGKTVSDASAGSERKVSLVPLEAGIKFRLHKGVFNPYLGVGGGYFQYKERTSAATIREKRPGLVGQTGFFVKIARLFVIDFSTQYKYCPMETAAGKFDAGGFHFGLGLGVEF
jgi:hypothetical protein